MSLQLLTGEIWALYEVPLSVSLLCFGIGDYVSQLPCVRYYVFAKSSLNSFATELFFWV